MLTFKYCKLLYRKYIVPVDPCLQHLQFTLKLTIACLIAALVEYFLQLNQGIFLLIGAFFVALPPLPSNSYKQSFLITCYTSILVLLSILLACYLGHFEWAYIGIMFVASLIAYHFAGRHPTYGLMTIMVLLAILVCGAMPADFNIIVQRLIAAAYGAAISIVTFLVLFPIRREQHFKGQLKTNAYNIKTYFWLALNNAARGNFHRDECYAKRHEIFNALNASQNLASTSKNVFFKKQLAVQKELFFSVISFTDYLARPLQESSLELIAKRLNFFSISLELTFPKKHHEFIGCIKQQKDLFNCQQNVSQENQQDLSALQYLFTQVQQSFAAAEASA